MERPAAQGAHPLMETMGPEPFSADFHGDYLFERARGKSAAVKTFLMDGGVVVGAGNIYAAESLFRAGIRPTRPAGKVTRAEPVSALYEQGRVHHIGYFRDLEEQMTSYIPGAGLRSPDRLDALVWAVTELMIDQQEEEKTIVADGMHRISLI